MARILPCSPAQRRFWFLQQLRPRTSAYQIAREARIRGPLDAEALVRALHALVARHESLRTAFALEGDDLVQVVHPEVAIEIARLDLGEGPREAAEAEAGRRLVANASAPFDLSRAPLVRAALVRLDPEDHLFGVAMHHTISDGHSFGVLFRDLGALYRAEVEGRPAELPELPPDYAERVGEGPSEEALEAALRFWREQLGDGVSRLELPTDRPRPAVLELRGARLPVHFPADRTAGLQTLGRGSGSTPFMVLLAGLQCVLQRYTGQDDVMVGSPIARRDLERSGDLIGPCINNLVLRAELGGDPGFRELLGRVRRSALAAYEHADVPFERLLEGLQPQRDPGHSPLFQVLLSVQPGERPTLSLPGVSVEPLEVPRDTAASELGLFLWTGGGEIRGFLEYNTDLFEEGTARRLLGHLGNLLEAAVADPERRISELPMLTPDEERQLLGDWNDTRVPFRREACVHELVEEQARRRPEAPAAVFEGSELSYGELERRANRLARHLRSLGVGPGARVALCVERSPEMLIGLLGVLKAGAAYVPLDPVYPPERIAFMLEDSGAQVILTQEALLEQLPAVGARRVCLDRDRAEIESSPDTPPPPVAAAEDLAYLIYTSGSTGRPKGVEIRHRSAVNFLESMAREPGFAEGDTLLAVTTLCFDIAFLELFGPLSVGARVVVAGRETAADGQRLRAALERSGATLMQATPATWRLLLEAGWPGDPELKLLCGGEGLPGELASRLRDRCSSLWNLYGPTEATVWSSASRVERPEPGQACMAIGHPIANTELHVLDSRCRLLPIGVAGELYIGGEGLARGYHRRPELDAERFVPHPFDAGARLYRTGDRVRRLPDGRLDFLGRLDHQVKLRGYRIELGEIEAVLARHPRLSACAVVARDDGPGGRRLVAYVVGREGGAPPGAELRALLARQLPEYMLPSAFVELPELPLTPNRKVDRKALPDPGDRPGESAAGAPPRTPTEAKLLAIWESVLERGGIGVGDDFFAVGGHSLLALRLFRRIEEELGESLPVASIFESPTIEALARVLDGDRASRSSPRWPVLVPLQSGGSRPPFFFLAGSENHPGAGLGPDQPVYRVQVQDLDREQPFTDVVEMAAHCLEHIRALQPRGPYFLGGHCFGGVVAYEIAQQLRGQGQETALLALLESYAPGSSRIRTDLGALGRLGLRIRFHARRLRSRGLRPTAASLLRDAVRKVRHYRWQLAGGGRADSAPGDPRAANYLAGKRYRPRPYEGRVTVLACTERSPWREFDPQNGWGKLAMGGVDLHVVPGHHTGLYREPVVGKVVGILDDCLRRARED